MNEANVSSQKVGMKTQIGYGIGQAGDTIPYCMFYTFFLYYLTDVAGIAPEVAGLVSLIAVLWDGITDPIIGFLSDKCRSKYGRRRPFMLAAAIPLALTVFLVFFPVGGSEGFRTAYYVIMAMLFWTAYTAYVIPYFSLAADVTSDYNGRNDIRMFNMLFGGFFMLICTSGPMVVLDKVMAMGYSAGFSWAVSGAVFGLIALAGMLICWFAMRGKEDLKLAERRDDEEKESIFKVIKETFAIRAYRLLTIMTFVMMLGQIIATTAVVYLLYDRLQLSEATQSAYWLWYAVFYIALVPVSSKLANVGGKRFSFIICNIITGAAMVFFWLYGINSYAGLLIYTAFFQFTSTVFWTLYITFAYDVVEIDAYKNGKRREGSLVAIVSFAQKAGSAVAMYITGFLLAQLGYNAELAEQSVRAIDGMNMLCTLPPAISIVLSILIMLRYPVTKKNYAALTEALKAKESGGEYSEEEFKELLK